MESQMDGQFEAVIYGALWGMVALMATVAILTVVKSLMPGAQRDRRDEDRSLLAYLNAWDLTAIDIRKMSRLSAGRTCCALSRLESSGLLESYEQGGRAGIRRYTLTTLGRETVLDLERARIDESDNDRHGA
jgi:hypothetical protein